MKKKFLVFAITLLSVGCSKDGNAPLTDTSQEESIPDDICSVMDDIEFMKYCYENFDANKDGKLSIHEANAVEKIEIYGVKSLNGIQYFSSLKELYCTVFSSTIDISKNKELKELYLCDYLQDKGGNLTTLDISQNEKLEALVCSYNMFKELKLQSKSLTHLYCEHNTNLEKLDISEAPNLIWLNCPYNKLLSLDVSHSTNLIKLYCHNNRLLTLNISNNAELDFINCANNDLSTLDISKTLAIGLHTIGNSNLTTLWLNSNQASRIDRYVIDRTITEIKVK